jgi:hypothetical protein
MSVCLAYQVGRGIYAQLWCLYPAINQLRAAMAQTLFPDAQTTLLIGYYPGLDKLYREQ